MESNTTAEPTDHPIATATRVPPDDGSTESETTEPDEEPVIATATRVP